MLYFSLPSLMIRTLNVFALPALGSDIYLVCIFSTVATPHICQLTVSWETNPFYLKHLWF